MPLMKFLFDLFPIILFFIAFKFGDIYTATIVAMVATIGQILWVYLSPPQDRCHAMG